MIEALLLDSMWSSLRWLIGIGMGVAAAILLYLFGVAMRRARRPVSIVVDFLRAIPVIALVQAFFALFGTDEIGKFLMIAWATAFPIYVHLLQAAAPTHEERLVFAAADLSRGETLRWLHAPLLASAAIGGIRIALGIGWISVVAAEFLGVFDSGPWSGGLGEGVIRLSEIPDYPAMTVWLAAFGVLGLGSAALFDWGSRKVARRIGLDVR
ncbi:MAG TPA: ABC transporter permease subunit [Allosphingosinicella sp.]|nr:ABC transporter permease subunit [Allosphingosinicella sp.]